MTDDNNAVVIHSKTRRPFTQLTSKLVQLVDDRFDEDQYDQAVELLEQLAAEGIRPPKSLLQKLVALSLCSLAPGQVASTSRWTLDHQLHDISSRLLTQHNGSGKSNRNVMKAASTASDRPSPSAVLKASSLLMQYSLSSADVSADDAAAQSEAERKDALLARQILKSLPSQRRPLKSSRSASPDSPRRSHDGDHDGSFEVSSIERWVRDQLRCAEDVWDLLCDRRLSSGKDTTNASLEQVREFWMNDSERKRYQKQLQSCTTGHERLEDRLKDIRWKKLKAVPSSDSSDSSSDDASNDDDIAPRLSVSRKRSTSPHSRRKGASPAKPAKRVRPAATPRDEYEAQQTNIKMTEGAWRTLSVLLRLWDRASPQGVAASAGPVSEPEEEPPLLWQFPRSHSARRNGRPTSKRFTGSDTTDELDRALDVAFSFPSILPAYKPSSTDTEATTNLFDTAKSPETRGDARLFSSVPEAELIHRQEVGNHKEERLMATRADAAAWLLSSIYGLVKLKYISSIAFIEGMSERLETLQASEVQCLIQPLLSQQPCLVVNVLARYLSNASRTRPDKKRSPDPVTFRFDGQGEITMDATLPYAMPHEEAATTMLRDCSNRRQDRNAKAVLQYLSLNKLELDDAANSSLALTYPSKAESRKQSVVRKSRRHVKVESDARKAGKMKTKVEGAEAAAVVTEEMKKDGLVAYAFVRVVQMEARDRTNQMKLLIARALVTMHTEASHTKQELDANGTSAFSSQQQRADRKDSKALEAESASQRRGVQLYLTRLLKALEHDAVDFRSCLSTMKTHIGKDQRRRKGVSDLLASNSSKDAPALPLLETLVERCQKYLDGTQDLARATRLLLDATKVF
ncbi:uncharacterized protein SPSC_06603 [Sporisorium scitamineum]|uniref:Uncharacterized protein n=1 Tax=Sporisorium scitamineum TaxID=49012 RepID=A0A0F7RYG4_9BASI|nr:hypothetical protein [Sporisorium scitamineum]CDU26409.1 uncharacterized protein SPSC_06603 [Sporisorium scitamineum]